MRKTLATSAVLLRYGWRSALGAFLFKLQSPALRILTLFAMSFWPLLYYFNNYRTLQRLGDRDRLSRMITEWNLPPGALMGSSELWPGLPNLIGLGLGFMFLAIFICGIFAVHLWGQRKGYDTELEWLQTFPSPIRSILWGRLLQSTVIQPYLYLLILPFLLSFVVIRGHNLAFSIVTSSLLGWIGMLAASSLGMMLHYFTKFRLAPARQRDIQFFVLLLLMGCFFFVYFPFTMNEGAYWRTIAQLAPSLQDSVSIDLMTRLLSGNPSSLIPLLALFGAALVWAQFSVVISERIVNQGSAVQEEANKKEWRFLANLLDRLSPVMRRETRILLRDRSQWVSMMSGPLFALIFMIWNNIGDQSLVQGKSLLLMCLMMYLMMIGLTLQVLFQRERPSLWFYAAVPMRLSQVLREQTKVPAVLFGLIYAGAFVVFAPLSFWQDADSMARLALGLTLVFTAERHYRNLALLSYTPDPDTKAGKPLHLTSWLMLTPAFVYIVLEANPWKVAAFLILFMALARSYEKKVLALEDCLIDPSYRIPRTADLAQGFLAALLYTFALMTAHGIALFFDLNLSVQFLAAAVTLWGLHLYYSFGNAKDVPVYFGAVRILNLVLLGLACPFILRAAGFWDHMTNGSAFLEHIYELKDYPAVPATAVLLFIAIARSVTEELIFRGLIQRGLSSRMAWPLAVISSAFLTTLCHKPQDFGPIFLTSLGSGLLYHRTKVLWPGIALAIAVQSLRLFGY